MIPETPGWGEALVPCFGMVFRDFLGTAKRVVKLQQRTGSGTLHMHDVSIKDLYLEQSLASHYG